jgi:hypothetical protein
VAIARAGDIARALTIARAIDRAGLGPLDVPTVGIPPVLAAIATEPAKAGDRGAAVETLREALELTRKLPMSLGGSGLFLQVAEAVAAVGDLDTAHEAASVITEDADKAPILATVARAQVEAGSARPCWRRSGMPPPRPGTSGPAGVSPTTTPRGPGTTPSAGSRRCRPGWSRSSTGSNSSAGCGC